MFKTSFLKTVTLALVFNILLISNLYATKSSIGMPNPFTKDHVENLQINNKKIPITILHYKPYPALGKNVKTDIETIHTNVTEFTDLSKSVRDFTAELVDNFSTVIKKNPSSKTAYSLNIKPTFYTSSTLQIITCVIDIYQFTGGAHGSAMKKAFYFTYEGKEILPEALLKSDAKNNFEQMIKKKFSQYPYYKDIKTFPKNYDLKSTIFIFDADNVIIQYPPYSLAPHSYGFIKLNFALKDVQNFLTIQKKP